MRKSLTSLMLGAAALTVAPLTQAQWQPVQPRYPGQAAPVGQTIVCESQDGQYQECRTPFGGPPVLTQQISSAPCVEGRSWGSRGPGNVWVVQGCRAQFADSYYAGGGYAQPDDAYTVRCESIDGRQRRCDTPVPGRLRLLRQLSSTACVEGQSWGSDRGGVWVRDGCRGDFGPAAGGWNAPMPGMDGGYARPGVMPDSLFLCESIDGRQRDCGARLRGRQVLVRQLSNNACVEGQTWGSYDGAVWVREGCRGEFGTAPGGGNTWVGGAYNTPVGGGYGTAGYQIDCASEDRRQISCPWDPRMGRPQLIEQRSSSECREGYSWGYDGRSIWVDRGCRGRFGRR